jgi:hypothetical protein
MFINVVREVVKVFISKRAAETNQAEGEIQAKIRQQADKTSDQYRQPSPSIDYHDSICRIAYLYRQGPAQAAVIERVLLQSEHLRAILKNKRELRVVAIGGGPGTELLGLIKLLAKVPNNLANITFDVLDLVPQWGDTWDQFKRKVKQNTSLTIEANFRPVDVFNKESYAHYDTLFSDADIVVFNYIFSENQIVLEQAEHAVRHIWDRVPAGCVFVIIDRNEQKLRRPLTQMLHPIFGQEPTMSEMKGSLDSDERKEDYGDLRQILGNPRTTFTAFSCVHIKPLLPRQPHFPTVIPRRPTNAGTHPRLAPASPPPPALSRPTADRS